MVTCLFTSLASVYLLRHVDSNHNDTSTIKFEQQIPCNEQLYSTYPECNQTVTNNEGMVDFHQIESSEQFLEGETDLLNIGDSGLESLLHCPTLFDGSLQKKNNRNNNNLCYQSHCNCLHHHRSRRNMIILGLKEGENLMSCLPWAKE